MIEFIVHVRESYLLINVVEFHANCVVKVIHFSLG